VGPGHPRRSFCGANSNCAAPEQGKYLPILTLNTAERERQSGCIHTGMKLLICLILALASLSAGTHTIRYGTRSRIGTTSRTPRRATDSDAPQPVRIAIKQPMCVLRARRARAHPALTSGPARFSAHQPVPLDRTDQRRMRGLRCRSHSGLETWRGRRTRQHAMAVDRIGEGEGPSRVALRQRDYPLAAGPGILHLRSSFQVATNS